MYEYLKEMELEKLKALANNKRQETGEDKPETCSIINAKSGRCSEDCAYCAQSSHHKCEIDVYPLKSIAEIFEHAKKVNDNGVDRFSIVTSGNTVNEHDFNIICVAIEKIKKNMDVKLCCSLGAISFEQMKKLKNIGVTRYHHNIETSPRYYSSIVTTHNIAQRIDTIKKAKKAGLEVCSGGIIGMGENMEDRIDMALLLKELDVNSISLNILMPIKGTKIYGIEPIQAEEVIRTIAIWRIILEHRTVRLCAGREMFLKDKQIEAFLSGASGLMVGGYLTMKGDPLEKDKKLVEKIKALWLRQ
ncbi:MAG: biotin synthase BioB [Candidatus Omnitrophica bacterium]|nr:biotin synthase BioB [Candidatus Omnitrophota bacterium]